MNTTNIKNKLEACIICTFTDSQETIIDTPDGFCHQECLDDQQADLEAEHSAIRELSEINNEKLPL
mgnify:FL=1